MTTWNERLRQARVELGLTRGEVAARAGLSEASVHAYEAGRRHPARASLSRMLRCLGLDLASRNEILIAAGYAPEAGSEGAAPQPSSLGEIAALMDERPWPVLILNDLAEVVAANAVARRLMAPGSRPRSRLDRSVLSLAVHRVLASQSANWDEMVAGMIALFKAGAGEHESIDAPGPYLSALLQRMCGGDAALVERFGRLWETTAAWSGAGAAWTYRSSWNLPQGAVRFFCVIHPARQADALYTHDWIPADAESHRVLEALLAR